MLETLWGALVQATRDAESTTVSPAYRTFFQDPENMALVFNILAQSSAGAAIHPPNQVSSGAPVIMCLSGPGQLAGTLATDGSKLDAYVACSKHPSLSAQSLSGTPFIGLCPYVWDSGVGTRASVPPPNRCLSVNARNNFNKDRLGRAGPTLTQYGMWVLLEEIAHIYLIPAQMKKGVAVSEVFDANDIMALSAVQTLLNAQSYSQYVTSIYGHCTDFPKPSARRPPEREVLAASPVASLTPGPTFASSG